MRNRFMLDPARIAALTLGFLAAAGAVVPASAASGTEVWREVNSYCKEKPDGSHNPCGAVAYGNGGGYAVAKVTVESRDNDWDSYPQCKDVSMSNSNDLTAGQYGVFVLPAPCEYKVTIKILAGDTKSNKVFLTPGCAIGLESKGTTTQDNKPHLRSVRWTDEARDQYAAKGITVSNSDVGDQYFHQAMGSSAKHYCNMADKADRNPNA